MNKRNEIARLKKAVKAKNLRMKKKRTRRRDNPPPEPYRSWFEVEIALDALERDIDFKYEEHHIIWIEPAKTKKYRPDYFLYKKNGDLIIVEAKGRWTAADRNKMCYVTEQNPDLDIRMLFERDNTLSRSPNSKRYSEWCEKKGIKYAIGRKIPEEWLNE